jgi:ribosomal protein L13E
VLLPGTDDVVAFTVRGFSSNEIAAMGLALYARYVPLTHTQRERETHKQYFLLLVCVCV